MVTLSPLHYAHSSSSLSCYVIYHSLVQFLIWKLLMESWREREREERERKRNKYTFCFGFWHLPTTTTITTCDIINSALFVAVAFHGTPNIALGTRSSRPQQPHTSSHLYKVSHYPTSFSLDSPSQPISIHRFVLATFACPSVITQNASRTQDRRTLK